MTPVVTCRRVHVTVYAVIIGMIIMLFLCRGGLSSQFAQVDAGPVRVRGLVAIAVRKYGSIVVMAILSMPIPVSVNTTIVRANISRRSQTKLHIVVEI